MAMVEQFNDDEDGRWTDSGLLNHPIINSKPLTVLPSRSRANRSSTASAKTAATTMPRTPAVNLQFINTAYPGESTTAKRISQIRSHVAKESHARRRQRKAAQARSSTATSSSKGNNNITPYSSASSSPPYLLAADDAAQTDESYSTSASPDGLQHPHPAWHSSTNTGLGHKGFRRIAPKEGAVVPRVASPGPRQMIGDTMKDAWNGQFAWELSVEDYGIFNYYLEWVLKYGYAVCFPPEQGILVEKRLRSTYVPFAMRNPALLALILYVAYHRRAMNTDNVDEAIKCTRMVERYRPRLCHGLAIMSWLKRLPSTRLMDGRGTTL